MSFNLLFIYTGGTIGSVGEPLSPLPGSQFEQAFEQLMVPTIQQKFPDVEVTFSNFDPTLDSTNLQPKNWCDIAERIIGAPEDSTYSNYDGFIVLHGTDTMAWTAAALSYLLTGLDENGLINAELSKPVIVTGSQSPILHQASGGSGDLSILYGTDAVDNVLGAVSAARSGLQAVGLFFDGKLMQGNRTLKVNASEYDAFDSPNFPYLARAGIDFTLINQNLPPAPLDPTNAIDHESAMGTLQIQLQYVADTINGADVLMFPAFPAQFDDAESALANMLSGALFAPGTQVKGVFLEGYGAGNFPSGNLGNPEDGAVFKVLQQAQDQDVVIVAGTQVIAGTANSTIYAAGDWLTKVGAIGSYDMTAPATQAKLLFLLALQNLDGRNWDDDTIRRLMRTSIAGEIMDVNRLSSRGQGFLMAEQSISSLDGKATLVNDPDTGPILTIAGQDQPVWQPLSPSGFDGPGRLVMQPDGNLVFNDRTNDMVWSTDTIAAPRGSLSLVLSGSLEGNGITLSIENDVTGTTEQLLYPA